MGKSFCAGMLTAVCLVVAAPVFAEIMAEACPLIAAEQKYYPGPSPGEERKRTAEVAAPDLVSLSPGTAAEILQELDIPYVLNGEADKISRQFPLPGKLMADTDTLTLLADDETGEVRVVGENSRSAARKLIAAGYKVKIRGTGIVRSADFDGNTCILRCSARSL